MFHSVKRPITWLLLCGLAVGCLIVVAEDAAAIERPSDPGPFKVGYIDDNLTVTTTIDWDRTFPDMNLGANPEGTVYTSYVRYFYPAMEDGRGTAPDKTGAPYATLFFAADYKLINYQDLISFLVSHGIVVMFETGLDPDFGSPLEGVDHQQFRISRIANLTEESTSVLFEMVDMDALGMIGHRLEATGATASCCWYPQFKATIELSPFSPDPQMFYWENWFWGPYRIKDKNVLVMAGALDPVTERTASTAYDAYTYYSEEGGSVIKVILPDSGNDGPWALDLIVSFVLYHLKGLEEYETLLYGEKMLDDLDDGGYKIDFQRTGNIFFPPVMSIMEQSAPIYMERTMSLNLAFPGYPVFYDSSHLWVDWYIDDIPDLVNNNFWNVSHEFPAPGEYKVTARWSIGDHYGWIAPVYFTVDNMLPIADPGPDRTVNMDEEVVFDGSGSWDTRSHNENLLFMWSFTDGVVTDFSNVSTYARTLTEEGLLGATLTVRDLLDAESFATCVISVDNVLPTVTAEVVTEALEDEELSFKGEGFDTPSHIEDLKYWWDFGDGNVTEEADTPDATHSYTTSETFEAILWVEDPSGALGNASFNITVTNVPPDGGFQEFTQGDLYVDQQIAFMCWYMDTPSDNLTLDITWDFGDGNTSEGPYLYHTYEKATEYTITLIIEDDDGATKVVTTEVVIYAIVDEDKPGPGFSGPMVVSVSILLVVILGLVAVGITEPGKYSLGLLTAPLFIKTKDVMDNKTRLALHGVIVERPGIHYSAIREEFGLANGAAAYHLDVLERESFIRSVRDGKLKRFYSAHAKVPEDVGRSPEEMRDAIVELVRKRPGINQLELMEEMGLTRDAASYYLRELVKEERLKAGKEGKYTVYTVNGRK